MKGLGGTSPLHRLTNPRCDNRFIFGHGVVIYYLYSIIWARSWKNFSIVLSNRREQCACANRIIRHRLTHATIIAQIMLITQTNNRQTPIRLRRCCHAIQRRTQVSPWHDSCLWFKRCTLMKMFIISRTIIYTYILHRFVHYSMVTCRLVFWNCRMLI